MLFITYEPYMEKDEIITYKFYKNTDVPPIKSENALPECFICYERIYIKHLIRKITHFIKYSRTCRCNISVHAHCFDKWVGLHNNCPVCRTPVVTNNHLLTNINMCYNIFLENHQKLTITNVIIFIYLLYNQIILANELYV